MMLRRTGQSCSAFHREDKNQEGQNQVYIDAKSRGICRKLHWRHPRRHGSIPEYHLLQPMARAEAQQCTASCQTELEGY